MFTLEALSPRRLLHTAFVVWLIAMSTACGWQLRGIQTQNNGLEIEAVESFAVVNQSRRSGVEDALKALAKNQNITVSNTAGYQIILVRELLDKRPLAVTGTGVTAQYQLNLTVLFQLRNATGDTIHPPQELMSWRSYDFDAAQIVSKDREEQALIDEMQREIAQRILVALKRTADD